jgi:hypothetical protein
MERTDAIRLVSRAARTPWRMEIRREGRAVILGALGEIVGFTSELNARFIVEAVNDRARVEDVVYHWDIAAVVDGAYKDDTL